jgi:uncharacterized membrane protein YfcA
VPLIEVLILAGLIFVAAALYSSVGHAGASGYLAAMAFYGVAPEVMKPTALVLNILVAIIGTALFLRAGYFSWRIFWPAAVGSVPMAFLGGALQLPGTAYKVAVGVILLFAAAHLAWFMPDAVTDRRQRRPPPIGPAVLAGAGIGLLSGLTGTGGGIFLSPVLLFMGWASARHAAGVSAAFILVNSIAGLAGHLSGVRFLPPAIPVWAAAAVLGGVLGAGLGSRKLATRTLQRLLAAVLVIAGAKLILARR